MPDDWRIGLDKLLHPVALIDELVQEHACDHVESFEHAVALVRGGPERRRLNFAVVEKEFHVLNWRGVGQVTLVVLEDIGNFIEIQVEGIEGKWKLGQNKTVVAQEGVLRGLRESEAPSDHALAGFMEKSRSK